MNNNFSSVRLELTSKCNINCRYCHNADFSNKPDDMSTNDIKSLVASLKQEYPIDKILLTGGEPLLNPDIINIIAYISSLGIKVDMVTNGKLLTKEKISAMEKAGLKRIRLSIDGFEEHKKYRIGSDPYELWNLCEYIKKETNLNLVVHTVCSTHNVDTLIKIYDKIVEIGVDRWRVFDIGYSGDAAKYISEFDVSQYYERFIENIAQVIKKYFDQNMSDKLDIEVNGVFKTNLLGNVYDQFYSVDNENLYNHLMEGATCSYLYHQMTIRSNGKSTLCQYYHDTIFDFSKYNYNATVARANPCHTSEGTMKLKDVLHCNNCKYVLVCNSGCRSKAQFLTGTITSPDPVACVIMPLVYSKIIPLLDEKSRKGFEKLLLNGDEPFYSADSLYHLIQNQIKYQAEKSY